MAEEKKEILVTVRGEQISEADLMRKLGEPFEADEIDWRVSSSGVNKGSGNPWVMVVPYLTSRAVQNRLDEVFGVMGWQNEQIESRGLDGMLCGLSVNINGTWITKWDGADKTHVEAFKGGLSGAMKRAAVLFGIGRYLYKFDTMFAPCVNTENNYDAVGEFHTIKDKSKKFLMNVKWTPPPMPNWALPQIKAEALFDNLKAATTLEELLEAYTDAYKYARSFGRADIGKKFEDYKNYRKQELEAEALQIGEQSTGNLTEWLNQSIEEQIFTATNESTVNRSKQDIGGNLMVKGRELNVDITELKKVLLEAENNKINQLQGNNHGQ